MADKNTAKFVVFCGVTDENRDNLFFSTNTPNKDMTKGYTGETWYRIVGYADTVEEAQRMITVETWRLLSKGEIT